MKERPIIFNGEMVRAILDGKKTQTRRVIKPQPWSIGMDGVLFASRYVLVVDEKSGKTHKRFTDDHGNMLVKPISCPYGQPGDRLWVREAFAPNYFDNGHPGYKADWTKIAAEYVQEPRWYPSIHMPRYLSRITLEVVNVRVERVQEINKEDAKAEGMYCGFIGGEYDFHIGPYDAYTANFRKTWDAINARRGYSWSINPWVWVIEFKVVEQKDGEG